MSDRPEATATRWLHRALGLKDDDTPFPWQSTLLDDFRAGKLWPALDLPTGLGKTSVMAIWLVARALGAPVPRRLLYVVDRRAVVDQATEVAVRLRDFVEEAQEFQRKLGLASRSLPVSTLRGQYTDNREWLDDPTAPAIIVGTVDMSGSRLLFQGYGRIAEDATVSCGSFGCRHPRHPRRGASRPRIRGSPPRNRKWS